MKKIVMSIALIIAATAIVNKTEAQLRVNVNLGFPVYTPIYHAPVVVYNEPCSVGYGRPIVVARDEYRYRDYDDNYRRREMHERHEMYERRENRYRDNDRYENRGYYRYDNRYRH